MSALSEKASTKLACLSRFINAFVGLDINRKSHLDELD